MSLTSRLLNPKQRAFIYSCFVNSRRTLSCVAFKLAKSGIYKWFILHRFMKQPGIKCLQVGGGKHKRTEKYWINGDIIAGDFYLDATRNLPFPDESLDYIFTEQFIEHLNQKDACRFVSEAYRCLKSGGVLRQGTISLDKISHFLSLNCSHEFKTLIERHLNVHRKNDSFIYHNSCQMINDLFRMWGHQFIYDQETLLALHEQSGFENITIHKFGQSSHKFLTGLERHFDIELTKNALTIFIEAEK